MLLKINTIPEPTEEQREQANQLDALHALQDRLLRRHGVASKVAEILKKRRVADPTDPIAEKLDKDEVTFVVGELERPYDRPEGGRGISERLAVLARYAVLNADGTTEEVVGHPVRVIEILGEGEMEVEPFTQADAAVVQELADIVKESGLTELSGDLLRLTPPQEFVGLS